MSKTNPGNFFEDYDAGQRLAHATPRTVTVGDRALYGALYPSRFALQSSDEFARACGLPASPLDDLAAFHVVFGKTVPEISLNAVANLGYAEGRFLRPVYPGDTLSATSEIIGLKENSSGQLVNIAANKGVRIQALDIQHRLLHRGTGRPGAVGNLPQRVILLDQVFPPRHRFFSGTGAIAATGLISGGGRFLRFGTGAHRGRCVPRSLHAAFRPGQHR